MSSKVFARFERAGCQTGPASVENSSDENRAGVLASPGPLSTAAPAPLSAASVACSGASSGSSVAPGGLSMVPAPVPAPAGSSSSAPAAPAPPSASAPFRAPALGTCVYHLKCSALEALSPTRCASCERPGALVCESCLSDIEQIDPALSCTRCGAPFGSLVCTECQEEDGTLSLNAPRYMDRCLAAAVFKGPPSRIIRAYKDGGERRLAPVIAGLLHEAAVRAEVEAPERYGGLLTGAEGVVFVPATAEAYRRRGFDHMELVARAFCERSGAPLVDALVKHGHADQRELGREERLAHASGAYEAVLDVSGMRLLLLDDVITTGATADAGAHELKRAGATHVDVLALARVW